VRTARKFIQLKPVLDGVWTAHSARRAPSSRVARRALVIVLLLVAGSFPSPAARSPVALTSWRDHSESAEFQEGGCGSVEQWTIASQDILCCPPGQNGERTCVQLWCLNYFCRVGFPIGDKDCWQDLYLCAILYCAESGAVEQLWAENDRVIACPPGPILTASMVPAGSCK
jgi:hypothetical protein